MLHGSAPVHRAYSNRAMSTYYGVDINSWQYQMVGGAWHGLMAMQTWARAQHIQTATKTGKNSGNQ